MRMELQVSLKLSLGAFKKRKFEKRKTFSFDSSLCFWSNTFFLNRIKILYCRIKS